MGCFYLIFALVIVPLFFSAPQGFLAWVQYLVQSVFQGIALPVLGFVAKNVGESQEKILLETHDTVIEELALVKEELELAKEERASMQELIEELHQHHIGNKIKT
jgi:uncharacterized sodium:solute symporter family permease YidK